MFGGSIKVIAFDADDTLWVNEPYFREAEESFCELLKDFMPKEESHKLLFDIEMKNLPLYGYGIKPFAVSLIEAAILVSKGEIPISIVSQIIDIGKKMLSIPIELIDGIEGTLKELSKEKEYRLVMATKGDLLDQERKLIRSGLEGYFHHIEVMSDKTPKQYQKLLQHLDCQPNEFLMVGNSMKSDILPVLEVGSFAIHIPFHTTWEHEMVNQEIRHINFKELKKVTQILDLF